MKASIIVHVRNINMVISGNTNFGGKKKARRVLVMAEMEGLSILT